MSIKGSKAADQKTKITIKNMLNKVSSIPGYPGGSFNGNPSSIIPNGSLPPETHEPNSGNQGYHSIERPDMSSATVSSTGGSVPSRPESSSLGVEDIDVGALFH